MVVTMPSPTRAMIVSSVAPPTNRSRLVRTVTRAAALMTMPSLATPSMVVLPVAGLGQSMTLGLTEVLTASSTVLPVPLVARSMAQARSKSRWMRAFSRRSGPARPSPRCRRPGNASRDRRCVTSRPDFMAVMRLSTIMPTGTLRSRRAMSSVKVTRAPENRARIQMLKKLMMMMANTNRTPPARPNRTRLPRFETLSWASRQVVICMSFMN